MFNRRRSENQAKKLRLFQGPVLERKLRFAIRVGTDLHFVCIPKSPKGRSKARVLRQNPELFHRPIAAIAAIARRR